MLLTRTWISAIRDTKDQCAQLAKNTIVGTLIGVVFWQQVCWDNALSVRVWSGSYLYYVLRASACLYPKYKKE